MYSIPAKLFIIVLVNLLFVYANDSDIQKAEDLVKKAASFIEFNGKEKGKEELIKSNGRFCKGNLYVFAYDTTGVLVAHPRNHSLIGVNLIDIPDIEGKYFRKEMIIVAKSKGGGWVDYKYRNPGKKDVEKKATYVHKSGDLILCCGILK